jgi:ketosteroid isomerase-like protein
MLLSHQASDGARREADRKNRCKGGKHMRFTRSLRVFVTVGVLFMAAGCAILPWWPKDEELIADLLADWKQALLAEDLDGLMALYSEDFEHERWGDKAGMEAFLQQVFAMGFLQDAQIDVENAAIAVEGDAATASNIVLQGDFGTYDTSMQLRKEEGTWRIAAGS